MITFCSLMLSDVYSVFNSSIFLLLRMGGEFLGESPLLSFLTDLVILKLEFCFIKGSQKFQKNFWERGAIRIP
jgi:hypothetical protein